MKIIQVPMDEKLLNELDEVAASEGKARAALVRQAIERMLRKRRFAEMERRDIESFKRQPQDISEIEEWEAVQDWGDEYEAG